MTEGWGLKGWRRKKEEKLKELTDRRCRCGDTLALLPGSKKVLGLIPCLEPSCVESVWGSFFTLLKLPSTVQKHACEVKRKLCR